MWPFLRYIAHCSKPQVGSFSFCGEARYIEDIDSIFTYPERAKPRKDRKSCYLWMKMWVDNAFYRAERGQAWPPPLYLALFQAVEWEVERGHVGNIQACARDTNSQGGNQPSPLDDSALLHSFRKCNICFQFDSSERPPCVTIIVLKWLSSLSVFRSQVIGSWCVSFSNVFRSSVKTERAERQLCRSIAILEPIIGSCWDQCEWSIVCPRCLVV